MRIEVLFEDNHIISVEKPPGMLMQGDWSGEVSLFDMVKIYIKEKYHKPGNVYLGLVHRIDKPVSGAVLFARTSKAAKRLSREFREKSVIKSYIALVHNPEKPDAIPECTGKWIELKQKIIRRYDKSFTTKGTTAGAKTATMKYIVLATSRKYALLHVRPMTGRKHQIRTQLSSMELPIVGDTKYGSREELDDRSICLHAIYLRFNHPTLGTPVEIFSDIPTRIRSRIEASIDLEKILTEG